MGKEAIQGSFDSFWFWPRKWNYWENPTFYKNNTAVRTSQWIYCCNVIVGQQSERNKSNYGTGTGWVGLYRLVLNVRMWHQGLSLLESLLLSWVTRECVKAKARYSLFGNWLSNDLPLTLTFSKMQVNLLPLIIWKAINGCRCPCVSLPLDTFLNFDYGPSVGRARNVRIIQLLHGFIWLHLLLFRVLFIPILLQIPGTRVMKGTS